MKAVRIEELDRMAQAYAAGDMNRENVWNLSFLDSWFVTYLGALYAQTLCGTMSRQQCAKDKFLLAEKYRRLAVDVHFTEERQKAWHGRNMRASLKISEAFAELHADEPDAAKFFELLTAAVDIFCSTDVHFKLVTAALEDEEFRKKCQTAMFEHTDEWREKLGSELRWEDYPVMLEKFYAYELDSGTAPLLSSLDSDHIRDFARRNIPVKTDYPKVIAENLRKGLV